jgi:hypothetical protein
MYWIVCRCNFISDSIHVYVIINFIGFNRLVIVVISSSEPWQTSESGSHIEVNVIVIMVQNEIMQPTTCKNYVALGIPWIPWNGQQNSPLHL